MRKRPTELRALLRCIEDGHLAIDNNAAERPLRGIGTGDKLPSNVILQRASARRSVCSSASCFGSTCVPA